MKPVLIINICKERLHYYEFVSPIEDILRKNGITFETEHYKGLNERTLNRCGKIIICGTSLKDNGFIGRYHKFDWLLDFNKPILGICGGMQIIGLMFGGVMRKKTEIGFYNERFEKEFLGLLGDQEVYHLHNNYVKFGKEFETFVNGDCNQAIKYKSKEIYGVLFHPEVRQKEMIVNFCSL